MKTLTDFRKTLETGVDPRLLIQHIYSDSSCIVSFILFNSSMISSHLNNGSTFTP